MSYLTVTGHRSMALDVRRNAAYHAALQLAIGPNSAVLDLGAGIGIHGLMAARLGAKRVYLVEPEDILHVAQELVRTNGVENIVRCLKGRIEEVQLPEPVDVIVSVLTGNFLLTEDLLATLFYARNAVLKPGGVLIPSAARMEAVPVSASALHAKEIAGWSVVQQGVDLSPARTYAANTIFYRAEGIRDMPRLADPRTLYALDFYENDYSNVCIDTTYQITQSGLCHGWIGWFSMKLGDRWLSTSPYEEPLHWSPAFLPLDPPMTLEKGERVSLRINRAPFGDWMWRVGTDSQHQQHSTLLSAPINAVSLKKASLEYAPQLNADGRALMDVLSQCDGSSSVESLAQALLRQHPDRYRSRAEALRFVQRIVKRYA